MDTLRRYPFYSPVDTNFPRQNLIYSPSIHGIHGVDSAFLRQNLAYSPMDTAWIVASLRQYWIYSPPN